MIQAKWQIDESPIGSTQEYYVDFSYKSAATETQQPLFGSGLTDGAAYPSKVTAPASAAVTLHQDSLLDQAIVRVKLAVPIAAKHNSVSVDVTYPIGPKQDGSLLTAGAADGFHSVFYWDNSD